MELFVKCFASMQGYAGALGQGALQESHGGSTYCGVAALHLLGALDGTSDATVSLHDSELQALIRWLIMRQQDVQESAKGDLTRRK